MNSESLNAGLGTVLVVDDDSSLRRTLHVTLSGMGFTVVDASRGEEALSLVRETRFDAVLLDVDIPGMGGVETCKSLRQSHSRLPILMLTAMDTEDDKVLALDSGADDYITKPFRLRELIARLRSAIRRVNMPDESVAPIRFGQLEFDLARYRVLKRGLPIHVTPKEFEVLHYLMAHAGETIPRSDLLKILWGPDCAKEWEYLRVYMSQLRKKIEDDPGNPIYIVTVPRVGYRFNEHYPESQG